MQKKKNNYDSYFNFFYRNKILIMVLLFCFAIIILFIILLIVHAELFISIKENAALFLGAVLTFISTTFLGIVSIWQNRKMHKINEELMQLQKENFLLANYPKIKMRKKYDFKIAPIDIAQIKRNPQKRRFYVLSKDQQEYVNKKGIIIDFYYESEDIDKVHIQKLMYYPINKEPINYQLYKGLNAADVIYNHIEKAYRLSIVVLDSKLTDVFKIVSTEATVFVLTLILQKKGLVADNEKKAFMFSELKLSLYLDVNNSCLSDERYQYSNIRNGKLS